jgi:phosphoribosylglycinamide formyltransferase 1
VTGGRIVVLVSGSGSNLEALVAACGRGEVPGRVVAVGADRACPAVAKAANLDIDGFVLAPDAFGSRDEWSRVLRDRVLECEPDLVVSAGFMRILAPVFVDAFEGRMINLHPSLLPAFPGAHAVRDALAAGATRTGTTVHMVDRGVDSGPVLLQAAVPIYPDDTEESLHGRIKEVEHRVLPRACLLLLQGVARGRD